MSQDARGRWFLLAAGLALTTPVPARAAAATLAVRHQGVWQEWWHADRAPERWAGPDPRVAQALRWQRLAEGVEWATAELAGAAPAWRTRLVVARIDPSRVRLGLEMVLSSEDGRPAWSIDRAPPGALLAVNAGQFLQSMPWGWLVIEGRQRLSPGRGALATALAADAAGAVHWIPADSLFPPAFPVAAAFQSYPTLLAGDGSIPASLRTTGSGVDLVHRDARLAIGEARDGRLLIAMTRFGALGGVGEQVPIGPTTPEMAAIMGALGARVGVMLDGGISAQMVLRDPESGRRWRWPGIRKVPLALIVRPRER